MNKFKRGDLCRCVEGFEDLSRRIVGRVGEVKDIERVIGRVVYYVRFFANSDPVWLPASHLDHVKKEN